MKKRRRLLKDIYLPIRVSCHQTGLRASRYHNIYQLIPEQSGNYGWYYTSAHSQVAFEKTKMHGLTVDIECQSQFGIYHV